MKGGQGLNADDALVVVDNECVSDSKTRTCYNSSKAKCNKGLHDVILNVLSTVNEPAVVVAGLCDDEFYLIKDK